MKKLLLVSHQLDFSGAPNALLSAAGVLCEMGYEIDLLPLAEGPLEAEFLSLGVRRIRSTNFRGYHLIILNTAVSARVAPHIPDDVKYLMWLHESPLLFVHSDIPFIVSKAAERAAALLFPTESTAQEWGRYGSLRSDEKLIFHCLAPVTIPSLTTEARLALAQQTVEMNPVRIITIDPVEYFRGHKVLARALQHMTARGVDVHYTAAGASPSTIRALFPFLQSDRLNATDRIPRAKILNYLAESHIYVSVSAFATQNLGLCEARLMGIPAVISDIPVHRSFCASVPGGVILSRLFDWKSIADGVEEIISNYEAWRLVSRNSLASCQKYLSSEKLKTVMRRCLTLVDA
jgi:glycosyltransferase involved in cell wall biosynthesis